jgi:hypothetical protein
MADPRKSKKNKVVLNETGELNEEEKWTMNEQVTVERVK